MLTGLAKKIVDGGIITEEQAEEAIEKSRNEKISVVTYLVNKGIADAKQIAMSASQEFGLPFLNLDAYDMQMASPKTSLKSKFMLENRVAPLFIRGNKVFIAVSDPTNVKALDDIKFQTNMATEAIIVEDNKLDHLIEDLESLQEMSNLDDIDDEGLDSLDISSGDDDMDGGGSVGDADDTPIVKFVNKMLLDAINIGASDLHFEPYEKTYRVRFRQDGVLLEHAKPPQNLGPRISTRLKVMSNLDISERRIPQDGRFKMRLTKNRAIDFRVSTCPTLFGEKIVMRILDPTSAQLGIEALGYEDFQQKLFLDAIHKPQGMVLVTGPTGSGKTVSLYTALNILNTIERNISTAEDPVEINLTGINQVNMNQKAGLTFSAALKSFLRQDPDIVMVGEIRDLETAEIAVKAAQTGHMVLSTLHTNSAPDTLTRLINMGVPAYNLATSINLIIAQRLARKLCDKCKEKDDVPAPALIQLGFKEDEVDSLEIYKAKGCPQCKKGYKGRVGLYEVMPISEAIGELIMKGANAIDMARQAAKDGVWNIRESGLNKIRSGMTTIEEVERVTKD